MTPDPETGYMDDFNSHAHVERDQNRTVPDTVLCYFNSHAHVERDTDFVKGRDNQKISTHTLTWSVTEDLPPF